MKQSLQGFVVRFAALCVGTSLGWAAPQSSDSGREFHWKGRLAAEQVVEIKNVNGEIEASPASGDEVEVTAVKSGEGSEEIKIEVVPHGDGVTICAVYPAAWIGRENRCEPGESWHTNTHDNKAKVHFTVHVPQNLRLTVINVNGGVRADSMGRYVVAKSVNGSVHFSTTSWGKASSVNGSIVAKLGRTDWPGELDFSSVNGSIELSLPSSLNADVSFSSVNGQLRSDFPLTTQGSFGRRSMHGRVGNGGRDLKLSTVNGNVELRQSTM